MDTIKIYFASKVKFLISEKLKSFQIIICALIALSYADKDATVLRIDSTVDVDGFQYAYETSNGIVAEQTGKLTNAGSDNEAVVVSGQYEYVSPEGTPIKITYTADETGYHPVGDLPVGPPIPDYIQKAIKLLPVVEQRKK